jgi:Tfp pilus assembly protein FimT
MKTQTRFNADGFSLVELIIISGMISVALTGAMVILPGFVNQSRADSSAAVALNTLRLARDRAIGDRRNMELIFTPPKTIDVVRKGISGEADQAILNVELENSQRFTHFSAMEDTRDEFGLTNVPIAFGTTEGTIPTIMFTSEGTLVDGSGDTINGTLFFGTPNDPSSARAVTIFGATALLRSWRWNGQEWTE